MKIIFFILEFKIWYYCLKFVFNSQNQKGKDLMRRATSVGTSLVVTLETM